MSKPLRNDCVVAVLDELRQHGTTTPKVEQTHKSIKIRWQHEGWKCMVATALTPSDHRAPLNCRTLVRREMQKEVTRG